MSLAFKILIMLFVVMQIFIMWAATPHHPIAYAIDVITTLGAVFIFYALFISRAFR